MRSIAGSYGAENGTSYGAAFKGFPDAAGATLSAGDTLHICGTFNSTAEIQVATLMFEPKWSGSAGSYITYDGNCGAWETNPSSWISRDGVTYSGAILNGAGVVSKGIRAISGAGAASTYIKVKNLDVRNFVDNGVLTYNDVADETADLNQIYDGIYVHDIGNGELNDNGFDSRGRLVTIQNSVFDRLSDEGIYHKGKNFTVTNTIVRQPSLTTVTGDGLQISGEGDGLVINKYTCDHSDVDAKQCLIVSTLTDVATFTLSDIDLTCFPDAVSQKCMYLSGSGTLTRFITRGGNYGIWLDNATTTLNLSMTSGIISQATTRGIFVGHTVGAGITFANVAVDGAIGGVEIIGNNARTVRNLSITGTSSFAMNSGPGVTEDHNNFYDNPIDCMLLELEKTCSSTDTEYNPHYTGGATLITAEQFRPIPLSDLCKAGARVSTGLLDYSNFTFKYPPSIGAFQCRGSAPFFGE